MKPFKLSLSIFFVTLICLPLFAAGAKNEVPANPHAIYNRVASDNISNLKINCFAQDSLGYMWIATFRGLNRYNSHNYHGYYCNDEETDIPDNQVQTLLCDKRGGLWVATINGVCYLTQNDDFHQVPLDAFNKNATQFAESSGGNIFVVTYPNLLVYDHDLDRFVVAIENIDPNNVYNVRVLTDSDNKLWVVSSFDVKCYDASTFALLDTIPFDDYVNYSAMSSSDQIWLCSYGKVSFLDTRTHRFVEKHEVINEHKLLKKAQIINIKRHSDGLLLVTERSGMFYYDIPAGMVVDQNDPDFPFDVPNFRITKLFRDSHDNIWMGSDDHGWALRYKQDNKFNNNRALCKPFEGKSVVALALEGTERFWVSTLSDGLWAYDFKTKTPEKVTIPGIEGSEPKVEWVFVDKDGKVWIAAETYLILKGHYEKGRFAVEQRYEIYNSRYITQDAEGTIWISTSGWSLYSIKEGKVQEHKIYSPSFNFIPKIISLSDGDHLLTYGFASPIRKINIHTLETTDVAVSAEDWQNSIPRSVIIPVDLYEDSRGDVWFGTITNGLLHYSGGRLSPVNEVICSDICAIVEDQRGKMWISTMYGLFEFDPLTRECVPWMSFDGTGGDQYNERAACALPDGGLVFGGTHGLTIFNPERVNEKTELPLVFDDLRVYNKTVTPGTGIIDKHICLNPDIRLKHSQNGFSISFTALNYGEFQRVRYSYCLEGFDKYWIEAGETHEASYANLPAGRYVFKVRIADNGKSVVYNENSLNIRILPSPWASWWAVLLYIGIACIPTFLVLRLYLRVRRERTATLEAERAKEEQRRINQMNRSFFSNISHEFRTPLSMISGPVAQLASDPSITGNNKNLLLIVQRSTSRMLRLVNQLLDFNKLDDDALKLQVRRTDLVQELRPQIETYRITMEEKGIQCTTHGLEDTFLMLLDADKLDKIMANLLSNAIKFTPAGGSIDVSFDVIGDVAQITVSDTGCGIPEDKLEQIFERYYQVEGASGGYNYGSGIGLYFARSLAHLHHGTLTAANREIGGTAFTLRLPAAPIAYSSAEIVTSQDQETLYPLSAPVPAASAQAADNAKNGTILVVDDDVDVVHYVKTLLSATYRVLCAYNAAAALEIMENEIPDLVLCDVAMPGMNGYELCAQIKQNIQYCHVPVILLTAKAAMDEQVAGLESGAEAYVTKPFDPTFLQAMLKTQLSNREKIRRVLREATASEQIEENVLSPADSAFMDDLYKIMEGELSNYELNVVDMAEQMRVSRTKIYYKVKSLTGESPSSFFKTYKLNRAAELLKEGRYTISEIADMTCVSTLAHFSTSFKKLFGVPPSEYGK